MAKKTKVVPVPIPTVQHQIDVTEAEYMALETLRQWQAAENDLTLKTELRAMDMVIIGIRAWQEPGSGFNDFCRDNALTRAQVEAFTTVSSFWARTAGNAETAALKKAKPPK